jgi:hypothetical protein
MSSDYKIQIWRLSICWARGMIFGPWLEWFDYYDATHLWLGRLYFVWSKEP